MVAVRYKAGQGSEPLPASPNDVLAAAGYGDCRWLTTVRTVDYSTMTFEYLALTPCGPRDYLAVQELGARAGSCAFNRTLLRAGSSSWNGRAIRQDWLHGSEMLGLVLRASIAGT